MLAATIDNGSAIVKLRAFGPPDIVALAPWTGPGHSEYQTARFWERIEAVTLHLHTDANVSPRRPTVSYFAQSAVPFAAVISPFSIDASLDCTFTFAIGLNSVGADDDTVIAGALPPLWMLPGYTLQVGADAAGAGDTHTNILLTRQRFVLIDCPDEPTYSDAV